MTLWERIRVLPNSVLEDSALTERSPCRRAKPHLSVLLVVALASCLFLSGCSSAAPGKPPTGPGGSRESGGPLSTTGQPGCRHPADVLDLRDWKLTLPVGTDRKLTHPQEIHQPDLADYQLPPWFQTTADCTGVVFRAAVNAPTTSGSHYPRSELREMTAGGSENASWSSTSGTHTMTVTEAFTSLPQGKPHLVGAQIHDAADDITVFRLEGSNLYVTDGDDPHFKLITDQYVLGTKFEAKFVVSGGVVQAFYNGQLQATLAKNFSDAYFKAGAYTQANCERATPCSPDNYGETAIYQLAVTHT